MSSPTRPQLLGLPSEVRIRIYRYVFSGERLRYVHQLRASQDPNEHDTICDSLLYVSKTCYAESRPVLLATVQIDVTKLIDPYYGTINSPILRPEMLRHVFVSANDLYVRFTQGVRYQDIAAERFLPIKMCLMRLLKLESLTFDCEEEYAFQDDQMKRGWIKDAAICFIQANPHRMIGLDDDGGAHHALLAMIEVWREREKTFKLYAEAKAYDYYDKRSRSLPLIVRLDLNTEKALISSQDYTPMTVQFEVPIVGSLLDEEY